MKYDINIKVNKLIPPLGENKYFAKVDISEIGGQHNLPHGLGEVWGKTHDEAYKKMNDKVEQWRKKNK